MRKCLIIISIFIIISVSVLAIDINMLPDLDNNNIVDGSDLTIFAFNFGKSAANGDFVIGDNSNTDKSDLNNDGIIDGSDLTTFAFDFGKRIQRCSDNTTYGQCSVNKPKYCLDGNLIDDCLGCGCDGSYVCHSNGNCVKCLDARDCDDNNTCTIDSCSGGVCSNSPVDCDPGYICDNGNCVKISSRNEKLMTKYSDKEVFLISDKNWKDVLPLVPLTTWTGDENCKKGYGTPNNVCVYPALIYHEEDTGFDVDSIIYFMQQYDAQKLTIIGETPQELDNLLVTQQELGAGLSQNQIQRINIDNYLSYWQEFKDIVYVEDNYELALLASTYASLINAPLIIQGTNLDQDLLFSNRNIICVGNANKNCNEQYNLEQLQQKYIDKTSTDKIILVNPNDLDIKIHHNFYDEAFQPEKSGNSIDEIYSRNSLVAPILASAKHEIILSTSSTNYSEVDNFIENKITNLQITPEYLTIIASPNAVEMSYPSGIVIDSMNYFSADAWHYSRIDDDELLDLAVGRIFGITMSDSSSNIARSLFYKETLKNGDKILVTRGDPHIHSAAEVYALGKVLTATGYQTTITPSGTVAEDWKNKFYIHYVDHGTGMWAGIVSYEIPYLDNSFMLALACSTCDFRESELKELLFCASILRKGGVGFLGATDIATSFPHETFSIEIFAQESTIGKAFVNLKNSYKIHLGSGSKNTNNMPHFTLLGDPTLKLEAKYKMPKPQLNLINEIPNGGNYSMIIPAMKFGIPEYVQDLSQYPISSLLFTTAFIDESTSDIVTSRFPVIQGFIPTVATHVSPNSYAEVKQFDDIWIRLFPFNNTRYFITANDYEFTNVEFNIKLEDKAPDLIIVDAEVSAENQELRFHIKNIGNYIADTNLEIHTDLYFAYTGDYIFYYTGWETNPDFVLKNINILIKPGEKSDVIAVPIPSEPLSEIRFEHFLPPNPTFRFKMIADIYPKAGFSQLNYSNNRFEQALEVK